METAQSCISPRKALYKWRHEGAISRIRLGARTAIAYSSSLEPKKLGYPANQWIARVSCPESNAIEKTYIAKSRKELMDMIIDLYAPIAIHSDDPKQEAQRIIALAQEIAMEPQ